MTTLTVQEWAKSMNISRQAAYAAIKRCGIPVDNGSVDSDVATVLYMKRTRARANQRRSADHSPAGPAGFAAAGQDLGGGMGDSGDGSYWSSRGRREAAEAELAELKLAEQRGELVRAEEVKAAIARKAAALRESLLQMPARLAAVLAAAGGDQTRCHDLLSAELRIVLEQLTEPAA